MRFYVLNPENGRFGVKWAHAEVIDPFIVGDPQICPKCSGPVSLRKWHEPHHVKLSTLDCDKAGDFLWGAGFVLMVSSQFVSCYQDKGLTGIMKFHKRAHIVNLLDVHGGENDPSIEYRLVDIKWNGANIDDSLSNVERKQYSCSYCRGDIRSIADIVIENGSWDGSDIFIARGLRGVILISEKFKSMLAQCKLRNVNLIPLEEYEYSY